MIVFLYYEFWRIGGMLEKYHEWILLSQVMLHLKYLLRLTSDVMLKNHGWDKAFSQSEYPCTMYRNFADSLSVLKFFKVSINHPLIMLAFEGKLFALTFFQNFLSKRPSNSFCFATSKYCCRALTSFGSRSCDTKTSPRIWLLRKLSS